MILCGTAVQQLEEVSKYCVLKPMSVDNDANLAKNSLVEVTENSCVQNFQEDLGQQSDLQFTGCDGNEVTVSSLNLDQTEDQINSDTADAEAKGDEISSSQLLNSTGKSGADEFRAEQLADANLELGLKTESTKVIFISSKTDFCIIAIKFLVRQFNSYVSHRYM